jgi:hypothetical protein
MSLKRNFEIRRINADILMKRLKEHSELKAHFIRESVL